MSGPDWVTLNAYSILGLPANAGPAEVHAAAATLRRAASLGLDPESAAHRTEAKIRAAVGRMANPAQRLQDRLFCLNHVARQSTAGGSSTNESVAVHDHALAKLFGALQATGDDDAPTLWSCALVDWHTAVSTDEYWEAFQQMELRADFEPAALPSELDLLRSRATSIAGGALISLGRTAEDAGNVNLVSRIVGCLHDLTFTGRWASAAVEELVEPTLAPILACCENVEVELEASLKRDPDSATRNLAPCAVASSRFRSEISPALESLRRMVPPDSDGLLRGQVATARCLARIASATTWTDDFVKADILYRDALLLAEGTVATFEIVQGLEGIQAAARVQRLRGKPIKAAPSLRTYNGIGVALYGHADPDAETGSYIATLYFVFLMIPIFPVSRYRVIAQPGSRFQFLGKHPFRPFDRWWLGLSLGAIVLLIAWMSFQPPRQNTGATTYSGIPAADAPAPGASDAASPVDAAAPATSAATGVPIDVGPPVAAPTGASAGPPPGSEATGLKSLVEAGRKRMAAIKGQLTDLDAQIEPLTGSTATLKSELDELDAQRQSGQTIDVSAYNTKVDEYNDENRRRHTLTTQFNDLVGENNWLLSEDRSMVARYNSGER